jgi:hypothetical protein
MLYYGLGVGPVGALIGVVLAVLPVPLYVALALRIDRPYGIPHHPMISDSAVNNYIWAIRN